MKADPFFTEDDHVVILDDREELSNGRGSLSEEVRDWLIAQAPNTRWTYRRAFDFNPVHSKGDDLKTVFKFEKESEALHFKMRWQG